MYGLYIRLRVSAPLWIPKLIPVCTRKLRLARRLASTALPNYQAKQKTAKHDAGALRVSQTRVLLAIFLQRNFRYGRLCTRNPRVGNYCEDPEPPPSLLVRTQVELVPCKPELPRSFPIQSEVPDTIAISSIGFVIDEQPPQ